VPGLKEKIVFMKMSETERVMYMIAKTHGDKLHMRQLCCHPQISNEDCSVLGTERKSMDQIKHTMIKHKKRQIDENKEKIKDKRGAIKLLTEKLGEVEEKIAEERDKRRAEQRADPSLPLSHVSDVSETLMKRRKNIKATITRHKIEIARIKAGPIHTLRTELEFFQSIRSKEPEQEDGKATDNDKGKEKEKDDKMEDEGKAGKGKEKKKGKGKEKADRMEDEGKEGKGKEKEAEEENRKPKTMAELSEAYGSKMANLIHFIREVCEKPDTRIIIFSQWDRLVPSTPYVQS